MIHRFHMTGLDEVTAQWKDYPGPVRLQLQVRRGAHVRHDQSAFHQAAAARAVTQPPHLAHGAQRRHLQLPLGRSRSSRATSSRAMPGPDKVAGFYMGPDGYCWGREAMDLEPESPRQLVMQKQWFSFMLWGRLSYDPTLPDALFQRTLAARFPKCRRTVSLPAGARRRGSFPKSPASSGATLI